MTEPLEFRDAVLTPLDAEGKPTGEPVHVGSGTVRVEYAADEPGPARTRAVEIGEAAAPALAQMAEQVGPVLANAVATLRPAVLALAGVFRQMGRAAAQALAWLAPLQDSGPVRLRDGRVVPLAAVRPEPLPKALRGKLRRRR